MLGDLTLVTCQEWHPSWQQEKYNVPSTHLLTVVAPEMMDGGTDEGPMDAAIAAAAGWAPGPMP